MGKKHIKERKSCLTFQQSPCNNTTLSVPGGVTKQEVFVSVEMKKDPVLQSLPGV